MFQKHKMGRKKGKGGSIVRALYAKGGKLNGTRRKEAA